MKLIRLALLAFALCAMALPTSAKNNQIELKLWKQSPQVSLEFLNIIYNSGLQKFVYSYKLTNGTFGSTQVNELEFRQQVYLEGYRSAFFFYDPSSLFGSTLFTVYISPTGSLNDVAVNIVNNAASQAVGNNVERCLNDLKTRKNRRVNFYHTSFKTTIDCRYY